MEHLIKRLIDNVADAEKNGENMADISWGAQEGMLISYNEAKMIIEQQRILERIPNSVLVDTCQHNWSKSHSKGMLYCTKCAKYKPEGA